MRRRSRGGGEPVKARRRKTAARKRGNAPKAVRRPGSSASSLQKQLDQRARERDAARGYLAEALEQQTATSEVLKVISQSAFDLKSVLQTLVELAVKLCKADKAAITRQIGGEFFFAEVYGFSPEFIEYVKLIPVKPDRGTVAGKTLLEGQTVHIPDVRVPRDPTWAKAQKLGNFRTMLGVPMLQEGRPIGVLALSRSKVQPFTDKQIELVQNFAAQAVIAIENTRLLTELRQSLEQQTATSDVLRVISSSAGELDPVFNAMLENATRICDANFGNLLLYEGDVFRRVALHNAPEAWAADRQRDPRRGRDTATFLYRVADTKDVVHVTDAALEDPNNPLVELAGARTLLIVPLLKENQLIGAAGIYRQEVRPFTDKQIEW